MKKQWIVLSAVLLSLFVFLANIHSQSLTKQVPIETSFRKSFLGGSYVLQVVNTSESALVIWLDARGKADYFTLYPGTMKSIGWAQGYRFDANEIFFIGAEGYEIFRGSTPSAEINEIRYGFTDNGALTINLSQTYLQRQLPNYISLPIKVKHPKIAELKVNEMPQIVFVDRSDKIYAQVDIVATVFSGKVDIPIKTIVSFVPSFNRSTGAIEASQIYVDNLTIENLPEEWFTEIKNFINNLTTALFSKVQIHQLDEKTLKYCNFFNVRQITVNNRRLQIELL